MNKQPSFKAIILRLEKRYGKPRAPKITDALGLIIHENIAYLVSDSQRDAAFAALRTKVGLKPTEILAAPMEDLLDVAKLGGGHPELRVARLKEIAQIVLNDFGGNLNQALKLPLPQARKALQSFPAIGAPGAEKILLFTRTYPVLALESNGLRVLLRLGFGEERKNYSASYASVQAALKDEIGNDCRFLIRAHQLLRQHGKELCRRSNSACDVCPLNECCNYYQSSR
jgi:endonuclease III